MARGATLVEAIVALLILAIGLLPLLLALNRLYTGAYRLGVRATAQSLAAERIDQLKAEGYLAVAATYLNGVDSAVIREDTATTWPYVRVTTIVYQKPDSGLSFMDVTATDSPTDYIRLTARVTRQTDSGVFERSLTAMLTREGMLE